MTGKTRMGWFLNPATGKMCDLYPNQYQYTPGTADRRAERWDCEALDVAKKREGCVKNA